MFRTRDSSRKYIDLIYAVSSKWANWDPPKRVEVGDYGTINRKTGQFEKEGNIYKEQTTTHLVAKYPPMEASKEDVIVIASDTVKRREISLAVDSKLPGLAEASIKGEWQFGVKRGALLIMDRPLISHIPPKEVLKHLVDIHTLEDKVLVTEVVSCPAYSLYLSSKEMDVVTLALLGTSPVPGAPTATTSSDIKWWNQNATGLLRSACDKAYSFSPLFTLKKIRKQSLILFRGPTFEPEDDDLWVDARPPWDPLNEAGDEEPFEDTIFYDEGEEELMENATSLAVGSS